MIIKPPSPDKIYAKPKPLYYREDLIKAIEAGIMIHFQVSANPSMDDPKKEMSLLIHEYLKSVERQDEEA